MDSLPTVAIWVGTAMGASCVRPG